MDALFFVVILIISIIIHELAHGYAALACGDETALRAGRLTANPIPHLDPIGSVALPLILALSGTSFMIGWAKPVPYDARMLGGKPWSEVFVASAGILANLAIVVVFTVFLRIMASIGSDAFVPVATVSLKIILVNIVLAVFNALPIPPLDGSRIVYAFLSERGRVIYEHIERYSLVLVIAFTFFGWQYVVPVVAKLFTLCTGVSL